jgi:hypothetical protein
MPHRVLPSAGWRVPQGKSDFLLTHNTPDDFVDSMKIIRRLRQADGFANAWYRYLQGPFGALRIFAAENAAKNALRQAGLAEQALGLAQTDMSRIINMKQVKAMLFFTWFVFLWTGY